MADDLFQESDNATHLTPEEKAELIPAHIAYRKELNEAEQENIAWGETGCLPKTRPAKRKIYPGSPCAHAGGRMALGGEIQDKGTKSRHPLL
jgi:hypothetical protein